MFCGVLFLIVVVMWLWRFFFGYLFWVVCLFRMWLRWGCKFRGRRSNIVVFGMWWRRFIVMKVIGVLWVGWCCGCFGWFCWLLLCLLFMISLWNVWICNCGLVIFWIWFWWFCCMFSINVYVGNWVFWGFLR